MDYYTIYHMPIYSMLYASFKNKLLLPVFQFDKIAKIKTFHRGPIRTKQELQLERFRANRSKL